MTTLNTFALAAGLLLASVSLLAAVFRWWSPLTRSALQMVVPVLLLLVVATSATPTRGDVVFGFVAGLVFYGAGLRVDELLDRRRAEIEELEHLLKSPGGNR